MYQLVTHFLILLTMSLTEAEEVLVFKGQDERSKCKPNFDCIVLGGSCVTNVALCEGRLAPSWCKGKKCQCCIPVNQCVLEGSANSVLWHKMDMSEIAIKDFINKGCNNVTGAIEIKIDILEKGIEVLVKDLSDSNSEIEDDLQSIKENQEMTHTKLNMLLNKTTSPTLPTLPTSNCPTCPDVTSEPSPTTAVSLTPAPPTLPPTTAAAPCAHIAGMITIGTEQFKIFTDKQYTWSAANQRCSGAGLVMAEPHDPPTVAQYLRGTYGNRWFWLGARGNGWTFVGNSGKAISNGSPYWAFGQPTGRFGFCLLTNVDGTTYFAHPCTVPQTYAICQCDE